MTSPRRSGRSTTPKPDPLRWIHTPDGRRVGFVRAKSDAQARAYIEDVFANDEVIDPHHPTGPRKSIRKPVHWRDRPYVLRKAGQQPPGKKRKR